MSIFTTCNKDFIIKFFCNLDFTFQKISSGRIKSWVATELLTLVEGWYFIHSTISSKNILNGSGLIWPNRSKKWDSWYKISRYDHISILFNYDVRVKLVCFDLSVIGLDNLNQTLVSIVQNFLRLNWFQLIDRQGHYYWAFLD